MQDLRGKIVLITGASTGIGAAAARAFGAQGARVAVHYHASRDAAEAVAEDVRKAGGESALVAGDVTRSEAPRAIVDEVVRVFGGLDVLVNNAGGLVRRTPVAEYTDEYVDAVIALNIKHVV